MIHNLGPMGVILAPVFSGVILAPVGVILAPVGPQGWFLVTRRQKILVFGAFWCSGGRKYRFLVTRRQKMMLRRQKILIFGAPAAENIGFR